MITFVHNFHHKEKPATIQLPDIRITSKSRTFKVRVTFNIWFSSSSTSSRVVAIAVVAVTILVDSKRIMAYKQTNISKILHNSRC